jgi:hypothetical protein
MKRKVNKNRKNQKVKRKSAGINKGCKYRLTNNGRWMPLLQTT